MDHITTRQRVEKFLIKMSKKKCQILKLAVYLFNSFHKGFSGFSFA